MKYTTEQRSEHSKIFSFTEKNNLGESLIVKVTKIECNLEDKKSLMNRWVKAGYIKKPLPTYWSIDTSVYDSEKSCWRKYDPTIKRSDDGRRMVVNFDWMLEATDENLHKLLEEIYRRFISSTGKSATEIKMDRIREYAERRGLQIYKELPEGFKKSKWDSGAPLGSVIITNGKSFFKGELKEALLLV